MKISRFLGASALASISFAVPSMAFAQTATSVPGDAAATTTNNDTTDAIVVTGSRIRRPNDESTAPITSVTNAEIFQSGRISIGDVLNDLPQLRSTVSSQNSTSGLGVRGLNLVDLRGLGTARTLVLINGRRHVSSEIINNGNATDINTIPADLLERVDILTGGYSAIYGSDAIAGVVNFILKQNYDGVQLHGQTGVSTYHDAGNQYVSLLAGKNFMEGRGNVALNVEYSHQSRYFASDRPDLARADAFVVVETDPTGSVNGSNGNPDRLFFRDVRSTTISTGGQVGIRQGTAAPCGADRYGAAFTCASLFQPDGSLAPQTGLRVGLGPNGTFVGGNGYIGREGQLLTLSPELCRINVNAIGHLALSPSLVPYFEAKYVRSTAFGSQSGPFFSQGQTLGDSITVAGVNDRSFNTGTVNREGIRLDNPFLSAAARATLAQQITAAITAGVNPNTGGPLSAGNQAISLAQVANGSYRFSLRRNYVDLGIRDERITRDTYRGVLGVKGDFADDFHYDISANYGEHKETNVIQGNINRQRFLLANDSGRNAAGQIVCRSQLDPAYAGADRGGNPAVLAADIAACVPLNPFGDGNISDAAKRYLTATTVATGKATQFVASGFITGNLHKLFDLPGGPIGFSAGAEYRRETLNYNLDPLTQAGYNFYNAIPSFSPPSFEVKEAFGEVSIPLLKDLPFFQELTFSASGRAAKYKGMAKTVYAYSGGRRVEADRRPPFPRDLFAVCARAVSRRAILPSVAELRAELHRPLLGTQPGAGFGNARRELQRGGRSGGV